MKGRIMDVNQRILNSGRLPEPPALDGLIDEFIKWASDKTANQCFINDYLVLMKINNGLQYNGLVIYNIHQEDLHNSLYSANEVWWAQEWNRRYMFIADSNISWYCFDMIENTYYELDKPSGDRIKEFRCLEELIDNSLNDVL